VSETFLQRFRSLGDVADAGADDEALREANERLHLALSAAGAGSWTLDLVRDELRFDRQILLALGHSADLPPIPFAVFLGIVHPDDRAALSDAVKRCVDEDVVLDQRFRALHADGSALHLAVRGRAIRTPDGRPLRLVGVGLDHSNSFRAEERLRESEQKLRRLTQQIPGAVFQYRLMPDGRHAFPYLSDGIETLYGVPAQEGMAESSAIFDRIVAEDRGRIETSIRHSAATLDVWRDEFRIRRRDGALRWVAGSAAPDCLADGSVLWHGWIIDVTDTKEAETERRALEVKLQHAQKLESLGVLAGGIAHDFNNLLTGILGHADLALEALPAGSDVRENVLQMVTAARRAAELSKQMLAYSGKGRFTLKRLHLPELVTEMAHLLEVSISKGSALRRELAATPAIEADPTQLRQVVMNLILNASDAIGDESGLIIVRTGAKQCDRAYLASCYLDDALAPGPYAFLEVEDTGPGMDADTVARIFEPFFTTKFAGRGLGLAAVLGIVRGHRGAIRIQSELGRGTVFRVLFPVCAEPAEPLDAPPAMAPAFRGRGVALVVDDEATVRRLAKTMLERLGFEVLLAADGQQAIDLYREHAERVRIVVLDMTMHPLDGAATFRELQRVRGDVKVVLSSGYSEQDATRTFRGTGLAGFLQKPYRLDDLAGVLRAVLDEG